MKISKPKHIYAGHLSPTKLRLEDQSGEFYYTCVEAMNKEEPSIELCEYNSVCKMPRENYCYKVRSENCRPYKFYSKYPNWVYDRNNGGMFV